MTRPTDKRRDKRGSALRARSEASMIARMRAARLSAAPAPKSDAELIAEAIAAGFDGTSHAASAACPSSRQATAPSGLSRAPSPSSPGRDCIDRMGVEATEMRRVTLTAAATDAVRSPPKEVVQLYANPAMMRAASGRVHIQPCAPSNGRSAEAGPQV